jgi:predicted O-methyltransferase YrrM
MFTNNWFEITGKDNFKKYVLPLKSKALNYLEVGCYEGQASVWLLENSRAELTVVDTFKRGQDLPDEVNLFERFNENTKDYYKRIRARIGRSSEMLKTLEPDFFDFIYIDGSHLASDVLEDAVLAFPLLKKGGIMIFDDYTWGQSLDMYQRPCFGIDSFTNVYGDQIEIIDRNSQLVIKKL